MKYDFDRYMERRGTECEKWDGMTEDFGTNDLLAMWVADMDFPAAPEILDAIFAAGAGGKIFFGSDWPILGLPRYEKLAAQTKLSDGDKEKLFGGNVRKFLGI